MKVRMVLSGLLLSIVSTVAISQTCPVGYVWDDCNHTSVGPGPCVPQCIPDPNYSPNDPVGPAKVCIKQDCYTVSYSWLDRCVVAQAKVGEEDYQVLGWAGPCLSDVNAECPDIKNQAHRDLFNNVLRVNRAWAIQP